VKQNWNKILKQIVSVVSALSTRWKIKRLAHEKCNLNETLSSVFAWNNTVSYFSFISYRASWFRRHELYAASKKAEPSTREIAFSQISAALRYNDKATFCGKMTPILQLTVIYAANANGHDEALLIGHSTALTGSSSSCYRLRRYHRRPTPLTKLHCTCTLVTVLCINGYNIAVTSVC